MGFVACAVLGKWYEVSLSKEAYELGFDFTSSVDVDVLVVFLKIF